MIKHKLGAVSCLVTGRIGVPQVVAISSWALSLSEVLYAVTFSYKCDTDMYA